MTMFLFKTIGFDSNGLYNIIPVPPSDEDSRYALRLVSNSFSDKVATIFFPTEEERDDAIGEFTNLLNIARKA